MYERFMDEGVGEGGGAGSAHRSREKVDGGVR